MAGSSDKQQDKTLKGGEQDAIKKVISDQRFDRYMGRTKRKGVELVSSGFEFAGIVGVLVGGGWWLDGELGTGPWLMLFGLVMGCVGGIYRLWRSSKAYFKR